jgi:hypothetical protein
VEGGEMISIKSPMAIKFSPLADQENCLLSKQQLANDLGIVEILFHVCPAVSDNFNHLDESPCFRHGAVTATVPVFETLLEDAFGENQTSQEASDCCLEVCSALRYGTYDFGIACCS